MWHNTGTHNDGTRSYGVTTNWYKLEKGDTATAWQAGIDDQVVWKNYITNPLATDAAIGQDVTSHSVITDDRFGRVRKIEASANGNWQLTFTAGNNYSELVGKVATFFIICKRYGGNYSAVEAKTEQLVFGGGDENVNVIHTNNCEFRDLGDGWRLYYSSRQIKTGIMSNTQGIDSGVIGVNTLKGAWLIYAAGVVQGGVCPAVADIMEACGLLATGIDITNKKVVITADNFTVQTNSGQKALVAANGKVNTLLLDAQQIWANIVTAQTGIFDDIMISGYVYKKKRIINAANKSNYLRFTDFGNYLDVLKCGQFVEIASDIGEQIGVAMPYLDSYVADRYTEQQKDECRSLIGNTLMVVNRASYVINFTGALKQTDDGASVSFGVGQNCYCYMECKIKNTNGYEEIYWLYKTGNLR